MKATKIARLATLALTLILELLPFGVLMRFANPEGEPHRSLHSYFSLLPYGYGNVGPLITAVLSCLLILLCVIGLWKGGRGLNTAIAVIAALATVLSCGPLMFGLQNFTLVGGGITLCLTAVLVLSLWMNRRLSGSEGTL